MSMHSLNLRKCRKLNYVRKVYGDSANSRIIFEYVCKKGYYNVVKWLHDENKINAKWLIDDVYIFIHCCDKGYLKLAKLLLEINPNIDLEANDNCVFDLVCAKGYLKFAKWLLSVKPDIFSKPNTEKNIYLYNSTAFINSCQNGHFKMAKWLLKVRPHIFIEFDFDEGFHEACVNGHIKIAKWLYKISPYKMKNILHTFAHSFSHGQLDVAKWLYSMHKDLIHDIAKPDKAGFVFAFHVIQNKRGTETEEKSIQTLEWFNEINLTIDYERLYDICRNNGKTKVIEWLYENNLIEVLSEK